MKKHLPVTALLMLILANAGFAQKVYVFETLNINGKVLTGKIIKNQKKKWICMC